MCGVGGKERSEVDSSVGLVEHAPMTYLHSSRRALAMENVAEAQVAAVQGMEAISDSQAFQALRIAEAADEAMLLRLAKLKEGRSPRPASPVVWADVPNLEEFEAEATAAFEVAITAAPLTAAGHLRMHVAESVETVEAGVPSRAAARPRTAPGACSRSLYEGTNEVRLAHGVWAWTWAWARTEVLAWFEVCVGFVACTGVHLGTHAGICSSLPCLLHSSI